MFEEQEQSQITPEAQENSAQIEEDILAGAQKLEAEVASIKELVLREKAENDNLRKRFAKELEESHKYAITPFARDMIEVAENLQRAIDNVDANEAANNPSIKALYEGIQMTYQSLISAFTKYGITRLYPLNEKFDHNFHQAILQIPTNEQESGICLQVIQAGYTIKDRLLRPAVVAVSKPLESEENA